jgi:hypothetical protein
VWFKLSRAGIGGHDLVAARATIAFVLGGGLQAFHTVLALCSWSALFLKMIPILSEK